MTTHTLSHSTEKDATASLQRLALGAIAGPILFALSWFVLGFVSPGYTLWGNWIGPYSPITQPISGLGMGITAPFMNTAFVLSGVLIMVGMFGVFRSIPQLSSAARWSCTVLFALSGLGGALCGIFNLEAFLPHFIGFLLAAGMPIFGFAVAGIVLRQLPHWRRLSGWLLFASPLTLALLIFYFVSFDPNAAGAGHGVGGLLQRILISEFHIWFAVLGWAAFRHSAHARD